MSVTHRGYKFRLYATDEQEALFGQYAGVCRLVYNLALEQRRDWWRQFKTSTGRSISYPSQARELTVLRAEFEWIAAVSIIPQQQALRDLDSAFGSFFAGRADYPTPRKRGENDAFRFSGRNCQWRKLNAKWGVVRLPKIGEVKFRLTSDIPGAVKNVTVKRDALGWHVVFSTEVEHEAPQNFGPAVGIDRGVIHTLALSDGRFMDMPRERLNVLDRRARKQARKLAKCKRGSNRRNAAKKLLARTKAKMARVRLHWSHERTTEIASTHGVVVIEALKTRNMTASAAGTAKAPGRSVRQKAGLNRAILNNAWFQFEALLAYKLAERGGELRKVNPAFTSQTCSCCGAIDKASRESQATFRCGHCGHAANADTNAARNILRAGTQPAPRFSIGKPLKRELKRAA
ncbi:transposase [Azospirillum sp. TSH7]|uniref:RNA-guided endonuclease InsQ/TnpB family protein n=1 Tax=unclassified Azospirillum TaxID=2630922 RepID=UPI000D61DFB2|nr:MULTISPECIES: RNA-guided endonuclease TnpB family protein [unclassified Azospirillum]PWC69074.1 transposase [Azospirillum sp. TSH7]PWC71434.1 transposase [Azospirillum sp. TSH20]